MKNFLTKIWKSILEFLKTAYVKNTHIYLWGLGGVAAAFLFKYVPGLVIGANLFTGVLGFIFAAGFGLSVYLFSKKELPLWEEITLSFGNITVALFMALIALL